MIRNGENGCFRCVLHQFRVCYDLQIEFQKKSIFCNFVIFDLWVLVIRPSKFRPPGRISADRYYFREKYDHISLPFKMLQLTRLILLCNQIFVIFAQFPQFHLWDKSDEEFSRGVLTDRKVLPSKSMRSQLSNALSNAFIALLVPEISSFELQKIVV